MSDPGPPGGRHRLGRERGDANTRVSFVLRPDATESEVWDLLLRAITEARQTELLDAYTRDALLHLGPTDDEEDQDDAADDAANGAAADEMQSSWTPPTVAMQTETSIGMPQMMQNNEMMPHMMMQNLKQEMLLRMEMILRRRSI